MALAKNINNLKDVGIFSFCDDDKGNIEIHFNVDHAGDYKIKLTQADLQAMQLITKLNK